MNPVFLKCITYGVIAALTALATDIANVKDLSSLESGDILRIVINILLQISIAIKAFLDPSSSASTLYNTQNSSEH